VSRIELREVQLELRVALEASVRMKEELVQRREVYETEVKVRSGEISCKREQCERERIEAWDDIERQWTELNATPSLGRMLVYYARR